LPVASSTQSESPPSKEQQVAEKSFADALKLNGTNQFDATQLY
jgi:hypothetical protein